MNNKSFYAIIAFMVIVALMVVDRDAPMIRTIVHIFLCGGSFYYILDTWRRLRKITWLMPIVAVAGVLFNPIYLFPLSTPQWLVAYVLALILFYALAKTTTLEQTFNAKKEQEHDKEAE